MEDVVATAMVTLVHLYRNSVGGLIDQEARRLLADEFVMSEDVRWKWMFARSDTIVGDTATGSELSATGHATTHVSSAVVGLAGSSKYLLFKQVPVRTNEQTTDRLPSGPHSKNACAIYAFRDRKQLKTTTVRSALAKQVADRVTGNAMHSFDAEADIMFGNERDAKRSPCEIMDSPFNAPKRKCMYVLEAGTPIGGMLGANRTGFESKKTRAKAMAAVSSTVQANAVFNPIPSRQLGSAGVYDGLGRPSSSWFAHARFKAFMSGVNKKRKIDTNDPEYDMRDVNGYVAADVNRREEIAVMYPRGDRLADATGVVRLAMLCMVGEATTTWYVARDPLNGMSYRDRVKLLLPPLKVDDAGAESGWACHVYVDDDEDWEKLFDENADLPPNPGHNALTRHSYLAGLAAAGVSRSKRPGTNMERARPFEQRKYSRSMDATNNAVIRVGSKSLTSVPSADSERDTSSWANPSTYVGCGYSECVVEELAAGSTSRSADNIADAIVDMTSMFSNSETVMCDHAAKVFNDQIDGSNIPEFTLTPADPESSAVAEICVDPYYWMVGTTPAALACAGKLAARYVAEILPIRVPGDATTRTTVATIASLGKVAEHMIYARNNTPVETSTDKRRIPPATFEAYAKRIRTEMDERPELFRMFKVVLGTPDTSDSRLPARGTPVTMVNGVYGDIVMGPSLGEAGFDAGLEESMQIIAGGKDAAFLRRLHESARLAVDPAVLHLDTGTELFYWDTESSGFANCIVGTAATYVREFGGKHTIKVRDPKGTFIEREVDRDSFHVVGELCSGASAPPFAQGGRIVALSKVCSLINENPPSVDDMQYADVGDWTQKMSAANAGGTNPATDQTFTITRGKPGKTGIVMEKFSSGVIIVGIDAGSEAEGVEGLKVGMRIKTVNNFDAAEQLEDCMRVLNEGLEITLVIGGVSKTDPEENVPYRLVRTMLPEEINCSIKALQTKKDHCLSNKCRSAPVAGGFCNTHAAGPDRSVYYIVVQRDHSKAVDSTDDVYTTPVDDWTHRLAMTCVQCGPRSIPRYLYNLRRKRRTNAKSSAVYLGVGSVNLVPLDVDGSQPAHYIEKDVTANLKTKEEEESSGFSTAGILTGVGVTAVAGAALLYATGGLSALPALPALPALFTSGLAAIQTYNRDFTESAEYKNHAHDQLLPTEKSAKAALTAATARKKAAVKTKKTDARAYTAWLRYIDVAGSNAEAVITKFKAGALNAGGGWPNSVAIDALNAGISDRELVSPFKLTDVGVKIEDFRKHVERLHKRAADNDVLAADTQAAELDALSALRKIQSNIAAVNPEGHYSLDTTANAKTERAAAMAGHRRTHDASNMAMNLLFSTDPKDERMRNNMRSAWATVQNIYSTVT